MNVVWVSPPLDYRQVLVFELLWNPCCRLNISHTQTQWTGSPRRVVRTYSALALPTPQRKRKGSCGLTHGQNSQHFMVAGPTKLHAGRTHNTSCGWSLFAVFIRFKPLSNIDKNKLTVYLLRVHLVHGFQSHWTRPQIAWRKVFCGVATPNRVTKGFLWVSGWSSKYNKLILNQSSNLTIKKPSHTQTSAFNNLVTSKSHVLLFRVSIPATSTYFRECALSTIFHLKAKAIKQIKCWEWHDVSINENSIANFKTC